MVGKRKKLRYHEMQLISKNRTDGMMHDIDFFLVSQQAYYLNQDAN